MKKTAHMPELDGVRGIAILMVMVFHAFTAGVRPPEGLLTKLSSYGFAGVDLFFVLSGFLITGILLNAKGQPAYFRNFYAKRALRIWPLYYLLLLATFALGPMLIRRAHMPLADLSKFTGGTAILCVFLVQNLWYSRIPVYLGMTWSLAIEEQFYLIWPWLILLLSRKNLVRVLGAVLVLSPCLRLWAGWHGASRDDIYFETWFRLDNLSIGAMIALWCQSDYFSLRHTKWAALVAMLVGVPLSVWCFTHQSWPLMYSGLALASGGVVTFAIWCFKTNSVFGRPLRMGWLQYVGKVSYCLYLVHQPIYYVLGQKLPGHHMKPGWGAVAVSLISGFIVGLLIASVSWRLFESQILKLKGTLEYHEPAKVGHVIQERNGRVLQPVHMQTDDLD